MTEPHYVTQLPIIMPLWAWPLSVTVLIWSSLIMVPAEWCGAKSHATAWTIRLTIASLITIMAWLLFFITVSPH